MFPCCSTHEDLSIDETITNVLLILKKLRRIQLFGTSINSISNFFEKKIRFPCCSTQEDLSIDVSITNVGLILTKLKVISFLGVRTLGVRIKFNFVNFELFFLNSILGGFRGVVLVKTDLPIDASITNVGLILTKLR